MKNTRHQMKATICLFFFVMVYCLTASSQAQNESQILQPNQTLEREMAGAETHCYKVDLKEDEFFQVRVEQKGIDVTLKLSDASGNILATMDSPNSTQGPETLTFVAGKAGGFMLEVVSFDAKAKKGNYSIRREASRTVTAIDKRRVEVERLFVAGMTTSTAARGAQVQTQAAIKQLSEAQAGWKELADSYMAELTARQIEQLKINADVIALFGELIRELNTGQNILKEGQQLMVKSKTDSLVAKAKLNEALAAFQALNLKLKNEDKSLIAKVNQSREFSEQLMDTLNSIKFMSKSGEALSLNGIAQTYDNLGEWRENLDHLKLALAAYQEIITDDSLKQHSLPVQRLEAQVLSEIGGKLNRFGQTEESLKYQRQAIDRFRVLYQVTQDTKLKLDEALALLNMGLTYGREAKHNREAIEFLSRSLEIYRTLPNEQRNVAMLLTSIATQQAGSFDYQATLKNWEEALKIYRELNDKWGQSSILGSMSQLYWLLNNKSKANEYVTQNLAILQSADFAENWKKRFGDQNGFGVFDEFQTYFIEYGRLIKIALAYRVLEDYPKSLEYYERALTVARQRKEPRDIRTALNSIAFTFAKLEKWDKAVEYYKQALEISRAQEVKEDIAGDLQDVGWALLESRNYKEALEYQNEALSTYQSAGVDENKAFSPAYSALLSEVARIHDALGNRRLAIFYGKRGVNAIQGERQRFQTFDAVSQKGFLEKKEKHYRRLADWLIEDGRFAEAEQVLRMLKEEEYFNFVRRDSDEIKNLNQRLKFEGEDKKIIERYNQLTTRVSEIGDEYLKLEEIQRQLKGRKLQLSAEEQKRYTKLKEELAVANGAFRLFLDKGLVSELGAKKLEQIEVDRSLQENLRKWGKGTVALYTVVSEDRYRVILTTPAVQVDGKYEIKAADLNKRIFAFREALKNPKIDPRPLGKELYDILIKPIEKDLQVVNAKTLIWSLDGTLRYIPLAALSPDGKSYLIEKYQSVVITPKTSREISASSADWRALGLGASQNESVNNPDRPDEKLNFKELPGVKDELISIIRDENSQGETGVLSGKRFLDDGFTAENFIESLKDETEDGKRKYTVIHIASHFHLGSNWTNSFLLLGNGKILSLQKISDSPDMRFGDIELITLSACNTAFADQANGKEVDSLAEVIQTRSGKAVLATLWSVVDASTSLLMTEFYRLRKENPKLTKAEALQQAQQKMIAGKLKSAQSKGEKRDTSVADAKPSSDYSHPYYWSPFVLIGNWR